MHRVSIIRPSNSSFASPMVIMKKVDGSWRLCVDCSLSENTINEKFPIPLIDDLLDELHGTMYFSKLDLQFDYHRVRVAEEDVEKTAFCMHDRNYEFLVMPFGLTNAPSTFQSLMNDVFRSYLSEIHPCVL